MTVRSGERGNIFFTLFGAIALVGVVGVATSTLLRGPVGTVLSMNQKAKIDSQLQIARKLTALESAQAADCDRDAFIEPLAPDTTGACNDLLGAGTGCLPATVGAAKQDSWGTSIGYCGWNHGPTTADAGCPDRFAGAGDTTNVVLAVISAGPDRTFQTTCGDDPAYVTKGGDDVVFEWTYDEAAEGVGEGLWSLKSGDPDAITTAKDVEFASGTTASFGNDVTAEFGAGSRLDLGLGGLFSLPDETVLQNGDCSLANKGVLRRQTGGGASEALEICDGTNWVPVSGAGGTAAGGANGEIQFNSAGVLDGDNALTWNAVTNALTVTGTAGISGNATVGGTLGVTGATSLSTLGTSGLATLNSASVTTTLGVTGAATLGSTLGVTGATSLSTLGTSGLATLNSASVTTTLGVTGAATLGSTLSVAGTISDSDSDVVIGDGLNVTGAADFDNALNVDGDITDGNSDVTIGDGLIVTGASDLRGDVSDSLGIFTINDAVNVTGAVDFDTTLNIDGIMHLGSAGQVAGGDCSGSTSGAMTFDGVNDELLLCSSVEGNKWVTIGASGGGGGGAGTVVPGNDGEITFNNSDSLATATTFVYTATGRLGIGTAAPGSIVHAAADVEDGYSLTVANNATSSNPYMVAYRARGTVAAPTIVANNDELMEFIIRGYDGDSYSHAALLAFNVDGTPGDNDMPTRLDINLQADGAGAWMGDGASTPELTIKNNGAVGIGTASPASRFVVAPPTSEAVAGAAVITANACGTVKQITSTGNQTTNTTDTFTAPTASYAGCCMDVVNVDTADTITLDQNAKFFTGDGSNVALAPGKAVRVCSDGTSWYQAAAVSSVASSGSSIDGLTDAYADYTTLNNLIMGRAGAAALTAGAQYNVFIGERVGATTANSTATTDNNVAIGFQVMELLTTGFGNTAMGSRALPINTVGTGNTAIGHNALFLNVAKSESTAIGKDAMYYADTSPVAAITYNTALGAYALRGSAIPSDNTGTHNTALGHSSLLSNTSGTSNTAVGSGALRSNTDDVANTAVGYNALYSNTGAGNSAIGSSALQTNTEGASNVAFGNETMLTNTTGSNNTAIGNAALFNNRGKNQSTAVGYYAMFYADSDTANTTTYNTAVGAYALRGSTTAANNTGVRNTALGHSAMLSNTSGVSNTAVGSSALTSNTDGASNTAVGKDTLYYSTGNNNTGVGAQALGDNQAASNNTAVGASALGANQTGADNTAIGNNAGITLTTGSGNILIGNGITTPANNTSNHLNIGNTIYASMATDYVGIGMNNPSVALDVTGDIEYTGTITDVSDMRLKKDIHPLRERGSMLEKLGQVDTYSFTMKDDEKGQVEFGVMAQELEKIFPELVRTADDEMGTKSVNYTGLIPPVVDAVNELRRENEELKVELAQVKTLLTEMQNVRKPSPVSHEPETARDTQEQQDLIDALKEQNEILKAELPQAQAALAAAKKDIEGLKAYTNYDKERPLIMKLLIAAALLLVIAGAALHRRRRLDKE